MAFDYPAYRLNGDPSNPTFKAPSVYILMTCLAIIISRGAGRQCRRHLGIIIFPKTFIFVSAAICGAIALNSNWLGDAKPDPNLKIPSRIVSCIYSPIFLLHFFYSVDTQRAKQFITYGVFCFFLVVNGFFVAFIMQFINPDLELIQLMTLGVTFTTTQPEYMIVFLSQNDNYKQVIQYLEGECILSLLFIFPVFEYVIHFVRFGTPDLGATLWYFFIGHIVGMFIGWFVAKLIALLMKHCVTTLDAYFGILLGAMVFCYVSSIILSISGFTAGLVFCLVIKSEKTLTIENFEEHVKLLIETYYNIADGAVFFLTTSQAIIWTFKFEDIDLYCYCFLILSALRGVGVVAVSLYLRKLDKYSILHIYLHSIVFPTSTFSLIYAAQFYYRSPELCSYTFAHNMFNAGATMIINYFFGVNVLKWSKIGHISKEGTDNMFRILNEIKNYRNLIVRQMKLDRSLCQVNWNVVNAYAKLTLEYPYPRFKQPINWEGDKIRRYADSTYDYVCCVECPNMQKADYVTVFEPALRSQRKIMANLMRTIIRRMCDHCFIDVECEIILRKAILLFEVEHSTNTPVQIFRDLLIIKPMWKCLKKFYDILSTSKQIVPRKRVYRMFYYIRDSSMYQILNYVISTVMLFPSLVMLLFKGLDNDCQPYMYLIGLIFFVFDFFVNIFAFSARNLSDGIKTYFRSLWQLMDFISIIGLLCICISSWMEASSGRVDPVAKGFSYLKYARALRLLHFIPLVLPKFMMEIGTKQRKMTAYQCALAMNDCINEVLLYCKRWEHEVDDAVLAKLRHLLYKSKSELQDIILHLQTEVHNTTSSVKTKRTLNATKCCMNDYLNKLKSLGTVDISEFGTIKACINTASHVATSAPPTNPTLLFMNNYWVSSSVAAADFLKSKAVLQKWPLDHLLVEVGNPVLGVYILVRGHLVIKNHVSNRQDGDIHYMEFENNFISPGNSIGEIDLLTGEKYKYTMQCLADCQTYFIDFATLCEAIKLSDHPIDGLDATLWKRKMLRYSIEALMLRCYYKYHDIWTIMKYIQRAFVPDLRCYKVFVFVDSIRDIVVVQGQVMNYYTKEIYAAPYCIPRTAKKLILPIPKLTKLQDQVCYVMTSKLMIIPVHDIEPVIVLAHEESVAEMIAHDFARCPYHVSQSKGKVELRNPSIDTRTYQLPPELTASIFTMSSPIHHPEHNEEAKNK